MLVRILALVMVIIFGGGTYFWITRKPNPAPPVSNEIVTYKGSDKEQLQEKYGKVLIIYYSFTGITRDVATKVQEKTGGDLYPVQLQEPYPASSTLYVTSIMQLRSNELPALQSIPVSVDDYDTILVGSPVWWYTVPPPLRAYLAQTDFKGKTVSVFCTQGGDEGTFFKDFSERVQNAKVTEGMSFKLPRKQNLQELDNIIDKWLEKIK